MKRLALLVGLAALCSAQEQPGNFDIRCDVTAKLQSGAEIPFQIRVADALRKPLVDAKVIVRIETADHERQEEFKAPAINPGVYLAKPIFPVAGTWEVLVEVRRDNSMNSRTFEYDVPNVK